MLASSFADAGAAFGGGTYEEDSDCRLTNGCNFLYKVKKLRRQTILLAGEQADSPIWGRLALVIPSRGLDGGRLASAFKTAQFGPGPEPPFIRRAPPNVYLILRMPFQKRCWLAPEECGRIR